MSEFKYRFLILTIDEIYLKKKNLNYFSSQLVHHVRSLIKTFHLEAADVKFSEKRIIVESKKEFSEKTLEKLKLIPGVHSINLVEKVEPKFEEIMPILRKELSQYSDNKRYTFKVETKRGDKGFPKDSYQISREIGGEVLKEFPHFRVDVHNPEIVINIKVLLKFIYLYTHKIRGIGGLPIGTLGHMVTLLSGGFDSPVASYMMAKRGVEQTFIFFHAYPFVGDEVLDKIFSLMKVLVRFQRRGKIIIVPFGDIQQKIIETARKSYRTLFFRKIMIEVSEEIARLVKASGLITGDAIGQVSSQTLENISFLTSKSSLFIARPLLGMSKNEILKIAKDIKTHDISKIRQDDACSIIAPKHPVTNPSRRYCDEFERSVDFSNDIQTCLKEAKVFDVNWREEIRTLDQLF